MSIENISAKEFFDLVKNHSNEIEVVDVRSQEEYENLHIVNSKIIPYEEIQNRASEIDWTKEVIFICRSGNTSLYVAKMMDSKDKNIKNVKGGIFGVHGEGMTDILESSY